MYELWWKELVDRTARLVAKWQSVGFVHGVLNTDNMSLIGLTLDYGPFGFMEYFYDEYVPNYSDQSGRYSYKQQPEMCLWNLGQLAESLDEAHLLEHSVTKKYITKQAYFQLFDAYFREQMLSKFGLISDASKDDIDELMPLFFNTMQQTACDFTNAFRALSMLSVNAVDNHGDIDMENEKLTQYLVSQCATPLQFGLVRNTDKSPEMISLQRGLPNLRKMADILRNNPETKEVAGLTLHDIQQVLDYFDNAQQGDNNTSTETESNGQKHVNEMSVDEKKQRDYELWRVFTVIYRKSVEKQQPTENAQRQSVMNANNPKYILRNYMLQTAIDAAENGEYEQIHELLKLAENPFREQPEFEKRDYCRAAPEWWIADCVSCSS